MFNRSRRDITCRNCNRKGHYSDRCPSPKRQRVICYKCNQPGHYSDKCQNTEKQLKLIICYKCNQLGHYSDKCKNGENKSNPDIRIAQGSDSSIDTKTDDAAKIVSESDKCVICLDSQKTQILMPCHHICLCEQCKYSVDICPLCRVPIIAREKVYF